jgi:hypothetical protein
MTTLSMSETMDAIATALAGLAPKVYEWPADSVTVPCLVVGYPDDIRFDVTFDSGPGYSIPVWYMLGNSPDKTARDTLSTKIPLVAAALDAVAGVRLSHVAQGDVQKVTVNAVDYIAAKFTVEITT